MPNLLDLINRPRKRKDDYFEFIALSGKLEAFDLDKAEPCLSRPELRRCEAIFHISGDRWVLAYVPFPGETPPWVDRQHSPSDGVEPWERPLPPYRELDREDAARWFQIINGYELPEGLEPVAVSRDSEPRRGPTRLDHEWRKPNRMPSEEKCLASDTQPQESSQANRSVSPLGVQGPRPSKGRPGKSRNGDKSNKVLGYFVAFIESCVDAQNAGLSVPPLESQAQIARRLGVSEATISRTGRRWIQQYNALFTPKPPRGRRNDDGGLEAIDPTDPTEIE